MSPPQTSARRTKRSPGAGLGRFWILIVAIAMLVIAGALFAEFWPGFYPARIVVTGNARVDRATIVHAAGIARHRSIWLQNIGKMAARVAAIPFVGRATIRRYPPGTIAIRVTERVPFAVVWRGETYALVDDTLRVLEDFPDGTGLPNLVLPDSGSLTPGTFLQSSDARTLRGVYAALQAAMLTPARLAFDHYGQVEATTPDGLRLLLGYPTDLDNKVRLCSAILAQAQAHHQKPAIVDVRAPTTPVVTYANRR